ncbi:hypothetical protein [Sporosarcina newyorkensis]|uniref:Lipoprotein n=2 Tax=Sporosarcina TaxID=1569 RepID=A0A1T4YLV2_9BACL|nr:hypothetical protein [Sporosarcina newyorkensis]SKB02663.1 hypothetical protein SAMN04244570_3035 [Sporosarcina newyorkensis]
MKRFKIIVGLLSLVAIMSACNKESKLYAFDEVKNDTFEHLHGLGYIDCHRNTYE